MVIYSTINTIRAAYRVPSFAGLILSEENLAGWKVMSSMHVMGGSNFAATIRAIPIVVVLMSTTTVPFSVMDRHTLVRSVHYRSLNFCENSCRLVCCSTSIGWFPRFTCKLSSLFCSGAIFTNMTFFESPMGALAEIVIAIPFLISIDVATISIRAAMVVKASNRRGSVPHRFFRTNCFHPPTPIAIFDTPIKFQVERVPPVVPVARFVRCATNQIIIIYLRYVVVRAEMPVLVHAVRVRGPSPPPS